jgi:transcriptional regulator with XRE-family HTH domain
MWNEVYNMVEFSRRLKKLRTEMKLTQKQLAEQIGVQNSIISFYENGDRLPSPEIIIKLAAVLHVSTDYLMGVDGINSVDVTGLTDSDIVLVRSLVNELREKNQQYNINV